MPGFVLQNVFLAQMVLNFGAEVALAEQISKNSTNKYKRRWLVLTHCPVLRIFLLSNHRKKQASAYSSYFSAEIALPRKFLSQKNIKENDQLIKNYPNKIQRSWSVFVNICPKYILQEISTSHQDFVGTGMRSVKQVTRKISVGPKF